MHLVKTKLDELLALDNVKKISLNPLDAEKLIDDHFNQKPPFEKRKPDEFKDAIMINAIKQYQVNSDETIYIVSNDKGFRESFINDNNFMEFNFISDFLRHYSNYKKGLLAISDFISDQMDDNQFDEIIEDYILNLNIYLDHYIKWDYDDLKIKDLYYELIYIEEVNERYIVNINVDVRLLLDVTYREEEASYYDKEDRLYLIENFINALEEHRVTIPVSLCFHIEECENEYDLIDYYLLEDKDLKFINLDEYTFSTSKLIKSTLYEEDNLVYCNECGSIIGRTAMGAYFDYYGEAICYNCAVSDSIGDICPSCGRKVPHEYMMSGFCIECQKWS